MPYKSKAKKRQADREYRARAGEAYRVRNRERMRRRRLETQEVQRRRSEKNWTPAFCPIDGEGFQAGNGRQYYGLLSMRGHPLGPLTDPGGLSTLRILDYLTYPWAGVGKRAIVGFSLHYDWEWWLRDLSDEQREALDAGESVFYGRYELSVVPRKIFRVQKHFLNRKPIQYTVQDVWGFFGTSFVKALQSWDIEVPDLIREGKASRGGFQWRDLPAVIQYNELELELLEKLMLRVAGAFETAFQAAGVDLGLRSNLWYGPGGLASAFLAWTGFPNEFPNHSLPVADYPGVRDHFRTLKYRSEQALEQYETHPGALAYFGGRIETAAVGTWDQGYDYDLNSAYPWALSQLPPLTEPPVRVSQVDPLRRIGMYYVVWSWPWDWRWYPWPWRAKDGSVRFPRRGRGWIMSPELHAVLDLLSEEERTVQVGRTKRPVVRVLWGVVFPGSEGFGAGTGVPAGREEELSQTAAWVRRLADVRLQLKEAERRGEATALKLILNSLYGKTVQQVGSHKNLRFFVGAWITSVTRAALWRAIHPHRRSEAILAVMTDGVLSTVPLNVQLGSGLGEWEQTTVFRIRLWLPGVYTWVQVDRGRVKLVKRSRGLVPSRIPFFRARGAWYGKEVHVPVPVFIGWKLARHAPAAYGPHLRQFTTITRRMECSLHTKRAGVASDWRAPLLMNGQKVANRFFPPISEAGFRHMTDESYPAPIGVPPATETAEDLEELAIREQEGTELAPYD